MTDRPTIIREIVKQKAKECGLSIRQLANVLGVNRTYLYDVLNGHTISRPLIRRIAEVVKAPELPKLYERELSKRRASFSVSKSCVDNARLNTRGGEAS